MAIKRGGVPFDVEKCTAQSPGLSPVPIELLGSNWFVKRPIPRNSASRPAPDAVGTTAARADLRPSRG